MTTARVTGSSSGSGSGAQLGGFASLKDDIKLLERFFTKRQATASSSLASSGVGCSCFRIISASIDELVCEFLDAGANKCRINANICVSAVMRNKKGS